MNHSTENTISGISCQKESIFGSFNNVDPILVASSILIIIASVIFLNLCLHYIFNLTQDTPFEPLLWNLEHELMIVGFTALIFKIFSNLYLTMPHEWHAALEYADLLVPIVAIVFCIEGLLLILMTLKVTNIWGRGYHLLLEELLDKFYVAMNKSADNCLSLTSYVRNLVDRYIIQQQMKFRIYRLIFCDQYRIKRDSLAFDSYVLNVYEKYLLHVIEIQALDWLLVVVIILINLANRSAHFYAFKNCYDGDMECINKASLQGFTCLGK